MALLIGAGALGTMSTGAATAAITPGRGIAGVRIGDREAQARRVLGRPREVHPPQWIYGAPLRGGVGFDHRRHVSEIWTTSRRQRTPRGVGPGSSLAELKAAYPKARCRRLHHTARACVAPSRHRVVTEFLFRAVLAEVDIYLPLPRAGTVVPK